MGLDIDALAASHPPTAVAVWRDRGLAFRMRMHLLDDVASVIAELAGLRLADGSRAGRARAPAAIAASRTQRTQSTWQHHHSSCQAAEAPASSPIWW
jgi:hypothetical protein